MSDNETVKITLNAELATLESSLKLLQVLFGDADSIKRAETINYCLDTVGKIRFNLGKIE